MDRHRRFDPLHDVLLPERIDCFSRRSWIEEQRIISEIPIGEKYVLIGTVTRGAGQSLRTIFRLTDDTGTSLWGSVYDHDFPHSHHMDITQGDRVQVVGHAYQYMTVLDEFHVISIEPDPE